MGRWLVWAAGLGLLASSGAQAQMKGLGAIELAELAKNRTLDLRITPEASYPSAMRLVPSMIVHRDFGANATLGLGLANMYKRRGNDFRPGDKPVRSRKPAVTFQMRF